MSGILPLNQETIMYSKFTIPIPDIQGKIVIREKNNALYVFYEIGRKYDPKRQFNVPVRKGIGKVADVANKLMYPNEKYSQYFPNTPLPAERSEADRSCCLRIGSYAIFKKIVNEYNLDSILKKHLGERYGLLLDIASYMIVNEDNAGQYYPDYAFCHPLFTSNMKILSDSTVSRFFNKITQEQIIGVLNDWNKKQDHKQCIYISYDSSNKNCQAGDIDIAEFGNAKDDKNLPIVNLALAFDRSNKVPLFYEQYPGSINDVSQFKYLVSKVVEYKYKHIGFILDKGYFSKDNIKCMDDNGYRFIIMAKGCKSLVSELITEIKGTFETDRTCSIKGYRVYGTSLQHKLYDNDSKERWFHIYFSPDKMAFERTCLETKLDRMSAELRKLEGREIEIPDNYQHYFDCQYANGKFLYAEERIDVIKRELSLCGYFCIISSDKMTAQDAYILYKSRDASEKLFRADKSFLGSKSMRVCSDKSLSAKIFIEFIALIIRNRMYNLLKTEMLKLDVRKNYMTVPAAIRELEKIEMVRRNEGDYKLDHAVTKTQKTILAAFGMVEKDIQIEAAEISSTISNNIKTTDIVIDNKDDADNENLDELLGEYNEDEISSFY